MKGSGEQENKISRRHFLKVLGLSAVAYLVYKTGFFSYFLAKAITGQSKGEGFEYAASAAYPIITNRQPLDEDGIVMIGVPKEGGYSYRFDAIKDPTLDIRLDLHETGGFEYKQEGDIKFIRFKSHNPGTTGQGSYTARFHIFTENRTDENKQKYNWKNGAARYGWLTRPNDLNDGEWNLICRPNKILNSRDSIAAKLGGGRHSRQIDKFHDASCWNVHWSYNASIENAVSFEFDHPEYEHGHTVKLFNVYKPLGDRWFGCKVVSKVRSDKTARDIITYFNEDPIDIKTGKPKNDGWKKYFEFTHTGQGKKYKIPHTWGGAKSTWRNDWLTSIDVAYMNHREISKIITT